MFIVVIARAGACEKIGLLLIFNQPGGAKSLI
jgi:hypothetical protein